MDHELARLRGRWPVAKGNAAMREESLSCLFALTSQAPLPDLQPLELTDSAPDVHEELVLRRVLMRHREELYSDAGLFELLKEEKMVGELPGEAVRIVDQHYVEATQAGT